MFPNLGNNVKPVLSQPKWENKLECNIFFRLQAALLSRTYTINWQMAETIKKQLNAG